MTWPTKVALVNPALVGNTPRHQPERVFRAAVTDHAGSRHTAYLVSIRKAALFAAKVIGGSDGVSVGFIQRKI